MDEEGGAMEQQQIHFDGYMEALQGLHGGREEAVCDPTSGTGDEGKSDKETINVSGAEEDHEKSMEGGDHTQPNMEGNNHTQNSTNKDEEDSDVSSDSSIDVKNPYPTCHNFCTAVREENKRNKAIDRLIAKVN
eukprot:jgi/Psemu1/1788/gm1.1788_g